MTPAQKYECDNGKKKKRRAGTRTKKDWHNVQEELEGLDDCCNKNQMKFSNTKCKAMHLGIN